MIVPICLLLLVSMPGVSAQDRPALVAVAANLTQPLTSIERQFEADTGLQIELTFGSSGNFTQQIRQGAPFELFLGADRAYTDRVLADGRGLPPAVAFARGRAVFFVPEGSPLRGTAEFGELQRRLQLGDYRRIAIPNPEFAPFGVAATEAMQAAGVWAVARDRLLLAENAAQAVQFTLSGNVDLGIIPYSYVVDPNIARQGNWFAIPEDWHAPLEQTAVLLTGAGATARRLVDWLREPAARDILRHFGYVVPE